MSAQWAVDRKILEIVRNDPRYRAQAYTFVFEALDFAMQRHGRDRRKGGDRHLSVPELLVGMRDFAIEQYGPLARVVMESMGIYATSDFGEIVFLLVDNGMLNKQDSDSKEQFASVFDFREAFNESELTVRAS